MMSARVWVRLRARDAGAETCPTGLAGELGDGPWLVVVPHDDDLVLGMGLATAAAVHEGLDVHVAVATDGALGYVHPEEQAELASRREAELRSACHVLGLGTSKIHALGFADGSLVAQQGCRGPDQPDSLGQRLVTLLRALRPSTVFVCTPDDVHPDHRAAARETEIACVWAASRIWLERGEPIAEPRRFYYAVYAPFQGPPDFKLETSAQLFDKKLAALRCFESQGVIDPMIERLVRAGPCEYLQRARDLSYRPEHYAGLFDGQ